MIPYHESLYEKQHGYLNCTSFVTMKQIHTLVPLLVLFVGTLGNSLSFIVLTQRSMRKRSMYNYLAVLSVVDTFVLYSGILPEWLKNLFGYTISQSWLCKFKNVTKYTVSQYSVWIIVAVTVERYIATAHTLSAPRMCTRRRALVVMLSLFGLLLTMNGHLFFTSTIKFYNNTYVTGISSNQSAENLTSVSSQCIITKDPYIVRIWPWVDACFYSFIPFLVILSLNILIIRAIRRSKNNSKSLGRVMSSEKQISDRDVEAKLTRLLMVISFVFFSTTLPVNIVWIVQNIVKHSPEETCQRSHFILAMMVGRMLMYTNHSVNFFLYLFSGLKFRQKLLSMCFHVSSRLQRRGQQFYSVIDMSSNRKSNSASVV